MRWMMLAVVAAGCAHQDPELARMEGELRTMEDQRIAHVVAAREEMERTDEWVFCRAWQAEQQGKPSAPLPKLDFNLSMEQVQRPAAWCPQYLVGHGRLLEQARDRELDVRISVATRRREDRLRQLAEEHERRQRVAGAISAAGQSIGQSMQPPPTYNCQPNGIGGVRCAPQ